MKKKESKIINLTEENIEEKVSEGICLVCFWAPWCRLCGMTAPVIEKLAEEFKDKANICKVNTDEQQDLAVKYRIRSIPVIIFMKDGEIVDQMVGASYKENYRQKLNQLIKKDNK